MVGFVRNLCFRRSETLVFVVIPVDAMDMMLEEELVDLMTFCLQNSDSDQVESKRQRIAEIGSEVYLDGGLDALENFFFVLDNRIRGEIDMDIGIFRPLWNGLDDGWKY